MSLAYGLTLGGLLVVLALAAYVDRVYSEMGKFLAREYQDNIDAHGRARLSHACGWDVNRLRSRPRCCGSSRWRRLL